MILLDLPCTVQFIEYFPIKLIKKITKKHEFVGPICETTDKFLETSSFQNLQMVI